MTDPHLQKLTAAVTASYLAGRNTRPEEIAPVIAAVASSLAGITTTPTPQPQDAPQPTARSKADIRKSIRPEGLVSFEDGRTYRTLTRHLRTLGMTPDEYRSKHGLAADYPMACAELSQRQRESAIARGFGKRPEPHAAPPGKPARKPRAKKAHEPAPMSEESGEERVKRLDPMT